MPEINTINANDSLWADSVVPFQITFRVRTKISFIGQFVQSNKEFYSLVSTDVIAKIKQIKRSANKPMSNSSAQIECTYTYKNIKTTYTKNIYKSTYITYTVTEVTVFSGP